MVIFNYNWDFKMKKKNKEWIAYAIMLISTTIVAFNNIGQSITLVQLPFSRTAQLYAGILSFIIGAVWTLYIEKVLK